MKKSPLLYVFLVSLILLSIGCKKEVPTNFIPESTFDLEEAKSAIITANETFVIALNTGDSIALANCYTNDAKMMAPNEKSIIGRTAIQAVFASWIKSGIPTFTMKSKGIWGSKDLMIAEEEWSFSDKTGKIIESGKSMEMYKMEDGRWKIFRDCYNSDFPCNTK